MPKKIRLSWFLIASILGISLLPIAGYAILSLVFVEKGLDAVMEANLKHTALEFAARHKDIQDGLHIWREAEIATRWEFMPAEIREQIPVPQAGKLYQLSKDEGWLSAPREITFVLHLLVDGRRFYLRQISSYDEVDLPLRETLSVVLLMSLVSIFALLVFSHRLMKKVTRPMSALSQWAISPEAHNRALPIPDFCYPELNDLALRIRSNLLSERKAVEHERLFLKYSSHELRTPISVVRASTECLSKMLEKGRRDPAREQRALQRLDRASSTMINVVETLLWLSRNPDDKPQIATLDLEKLVRNVVADAVQHYRHRQVEYVVETQAFPLTLQAGAAEIVVGNIIRNAFQHTLKGVIHIKQQGAALEVTNFIAQGNPEEKSVGFGLGLELTRRLSARFGWRFVSRKYCGRNRAYLEFCAETAEEKP